MKKLLIGAAVGAPVVAGDVRARLGRRAHRERPGRHRLARGGARQLDRLNRRPRIVECGARQGLERDFFLEEEILDQFLLSYDGYVREGQYYQGAPVVQDTTTQVNYTGERG